MNKQVKQIRNEVERLIKWCNAPFTKRAGVSGEEILNNLLSFIDSLEEEPKVDLEKEIDRWWCSQFTDYSMKRVPGHKFVPEPAFIDETFNQTKNGKTKIGYALELDWQVDLNDIDWNGDTIREFARHFYELGVRTKDVNEIIKTAEDHAYFAGGENARERLVDKACEWIKYNNENGGCLFDGWEENFKKYIEE